MCTLSFVPTQAGYYASMNRDERLTRGRALAPSLFQSGNLLAVYPFEENGGTWIACNQQAVTFALLNWNLAASRMPTQQRSRGTLVPVLIASSCLEQATRALGELDLDGFLPFRLVGVFQEQRQILEGRWDGLSFTLTRFPWTARHWFSSGASDEMAERMRGEACRLAWQEQNAGSLPWLRALHSSHGLAAGPFSVCAHRPDAGTVSYSEIAVDATVITFRYGSGPPCLNPPASILTVARPQTHQDF
ncbi:MAG: NRDE family protein [Acidobacteria bacterium]|nr:NRDE family protein [Acidobacteriota bacterium]